MRSSYHSVVCISVIFLFFLADTKIIHEFVGEASDPREDVYIYREITLQTALPINLTILPISLVNSSDIFKLRGVIIRNPKCNNSDIKDIIDYCKYVNVNKRLPFNRGRLDKSIPFSRMFPVDPEDKSGTFYYVVKEPGFGHSIKVCLQTIKEYDDYYACILSPYVMLWKKIDITPTILKLQLFRLQLLALQTNLKFRLTIYADENEDIYWKRIDGLEDVYLSPYSCDIHATSFHDADFCSLPSCLNSSKSDDCIMLSSSPRKKRQWDIASFVVATGAATLAAFNRVEIEHLKSQIGGLVEASKQHEHEILEIGDKLVSFMKTTNDALADVHKQIIDMANTASEQITTLTKNMEILVQSQNRLSLQLSEVHFTISEVMRVLLVEVQNRAQNFVDNVKLAALMYHESKVHRIRNAIKSRIITEDMFSMRQLKESFFHPAVLDKLTKKDLVPLVDEENIMEYLEAPLFSAKYVNHSFLELAVKYPVKRKRESISAFRVHCLPIVRKIAGTLEYSKDFCPNLPYMILYSFDSRIYYEINKENRERCYLGSFSYCDTFLKPNALSETLEHMPCYISLKEISHESSIMRQEDRCSERQSYSDGSLEIVILDSGKIYLSFPENFALLKLLDGTEVRIDYGQVIPIEVRCGDKLVYGRLEYRLPHMFCHKGESLIVGGAGKQTITKINDKILTINDDDWRASLDNVYRFLLSLDSGQMLDLDMPKDIAKKYENIIANSRDMKEMLNRKIVNNIESLDNSMSEYKSKVDRIHKNMEVSYGTAFLFAILGFIGFVFLSLDLIIAAIIGQTICGMVARWRRGEPILRRKPDNVVEEESHQMLRRSIKQVVNLKMEADLFHASDTNKMNLKKRFYIVTNHAFDTRTDFSNTIGTEIRINRMHHINDKNLVRDIFYKVDKSYHRDNNTIRDLLIDPNFPYLVTIYTISMGSEKRSTLSAFSDINDKVKITGAVSYPHMESDYEDVI